MVAMIHDNTLYHVTGSPKNRRDVINETANKPEMCNVSSISRGILAEKNVTSIVKGHLKSSHGFSRVYCNCMNMGGGVNPKSR